MKNYNWIVTNLYTLDTATETEYGVAQQILLA